jgi:hypothetical protein
MKASRFSTWTSKPQRHPLYALEFCSLAVREIIFFRFGAAAAFLANGLARICT